MYTKIYKGGMNMEVQETTTTTKADMVLGLFDNRAQAEAAIADLQDQGYSPQDLSIMMNDATEAQAVADNTGAAVAEGATSGAVTGGAVGALAGLLVGVGALAIPGFGALLVGGPLAAALGLTGTAATTASGAVTGALAGGLIGALIGLGVPEENARVYEQRLKEGAILLAVPTNDNISHADVRGTLEAHNAESVTEVHA
jgi:hypothetical protein